MQPAERIGEVAMTLMCGILRNELKGLNEMYDVVCEEKKEDVDDEKSAEMATRVGALEEEFADELPPLR